MPILMWSRIEQSDILGIKSKLRWVKTFCNYTIGLNPWLEILLNNV